MNIGQYIKMYIPERIRKKTHNHNALNNIFLKKYSEWLVEYFKELGIDQVPQMICCNTLNKLPSSIAVKGLSFFVMDHALFDCFYDLNYILSSEKKSEFLVELVVKHYIEACYLHGDVDKAFYLSRTSPDIEAYKTKDLYYSEGELAYWTERTRIQEKYTYLHEANHYFMQFKPNVGWETEYTVLLQDQYVLDHTDMKDFHNLLVECYCDCEALKYMISKESMCRQDFESFLALIYRVPVYLYILRCVDAAVVEKTDIEEFYDDTFKSLVYRMSMMYYTISKYCSISKSSLISEKTYAEATDLLRKTMTDVRIILKYCDDLYFEKSLRILEGTTPSERDSYVREYLNLLSLD